MPYNTLEPISKRLTIVGGLTVVAIMAFGLAQSVYRNILFEQTLKDLEEQNKKISTSITAGYRDLEYYRSDQYKDKHAKENLGFVNPVERVLLINRTSSKPFLPPPDPALTRETQQATYQEIIRQIPVIEHWRLFLFHREKIEELRRSL